VRLEGQHVDNLTAAHDPVRIPTRTRWICWQPVERCAGLPEWRPRQVVEVGRPGWRRQTGSPTWGGWWCPLFRLVRRLSFGSWSQEMATAATTDEIGAVVLSNW